MDLVGIEPTTSSMPWKRAPSCATGPLLGRTALTYAPPVFSRTARAESNLSYSDALRSYASFVVAQALPLWARRHRIIFMSIPAVFVRKASTLAPRKFMRHPAVLGLLFACSIAIMAQEPAASSVTPPSPGEQPPAGSPSTTAVLSQLDRLQTMSSAMNAAISELRIEKWKADPNSKHQAEANAQSIQRNLTSALPGMITSVRSFPQDLGAEFKLYRNVNALYDVVSSLTESTGAFGPKSDYESLAQQLDSLENIRRSLGDAIEQLTVSTQAQLEQLRTQVKTLQTQTNVPPPRKVVVDDTEPAKKTTTTHKKKAAKPSASDSGNSTSPPSPQ